jgi:CBS domain containing-hemolysin-like protein
VVDRSALIMPRSNRSGRRSPCLHGVDHVIDGTATIRDLREQAGVPLDESPEYQTVAGFLLHTLHTVPQPGAAVTAHGFVWTVVDMDGPRIAKVKAEPIRSAPGAPSATEPRPSGGPQSQ